PKVGSSERLQDDYLRFGQNPSLAFAPSVLEALETGPEGRPPRLFVNFFGLLGPNGALPQHITEFIRDRQFNAHDPTLSRFLDVFNHRAISLFYRAWAVAQKSVDFDRPEESRFADYIGSLFGLGMPSLHHRDLVPDRAKLYFAGRLSCQTRNAEGLAAILEDFFGVPTRIVEFVGFWLTLPYSNQCRLGESPSTGALGRSAIAGSRVYDAQLKFRVRMGPLTLADFQRLLPNGQAFKRIKTWVRNYIGDELIWDLQCVLLAQEVPTMTLGKSGFLGWTTWLTSKPVTKDVDDPIFDPEAS
ncbi:MAG TPA: type VI secretion system baseplate subunit TssG, partial [Chthoniobacteraceae bacterium]